MHLWLRCCPGGWEPLNAEVNPCRHRHEGVSRELLLKRLVSDWLKDGIQIDVALQA